MKTFILTSKSQLSYHDKDGKDRNYLSYFLNDVLILKQKISFNINFEAGFHRRTLIFDEYLLNGKIYQKRRNVDGEKIREVSYPISKRKLAEFNIEKDLKILINGR